MTQKLPAIDTNVIIRFLTSDSPTQAAAAERLFKESPPKSLFIPDLIIAEIIYVLLSFYQLPKSEVIEKINILLDFRQFKTNKRLIKKALEIYEDYNISFADSYLCALVILGKNKLVYSFDKKLMKVKEAAVKTL